MLTEYTGEYLGEIQDVAELKQRMLRLIAPLGIWATERPPKCYSSSVSVRLRTYGSWLLHNVHISIPAVKLYNQDERVACVINALPAWVVEFLVMSYSHSLASGCVLYNRKKLLEAALAIAFSEMFTLASGRGVVNVGQLHDRISHVLETSSVVNDALSRL